MKKIRELLISMSYKIGYAIGRIIAKSSANKKIEEHYYIAEDPDFEKDLKIACQMVKVRKIANPMPNSYGLIGFVKDLSSKCKVMPIDVCRVLAENKTLKLYEVVSKLCVLCGESGDVDYIYSLFNKYFVENDKYMPYIYETDESEYYDICQEKDTNKLYYIDKNGDRIYIDENDDYDYGEFDILHNMPMSELYFEEDDPDVDLLFDDEQNEENE